MANSTSHVLPYPIRKARYTLPLNFRVAAGTPTDPTSPDTEYSSDGGASFSDTAEEVTTGGSQGAGYLTLSGAEMDSNFIHVAGKSANCVLTPVIIVPRHLAIVGSGTLSAGSAGGGTLGTLLMYDVTGCFIRTTGGTGGGGAGGANNQARRIVTYNTSNGAFTVSPNWETTPDNTTTYDVLLPEGVTLGMLKTLNPATPGRVLVVDSAGLADATAVKLGPSGAATAQTARDVGASVLLSPGTGSGQVALSGGQVTVGTNNDKTNYQLAASAIQAIWDALTAALSTAGSIGKLLVDNLNATIGSRLASGSYTAPDNSGIASAASAAAAAAASAASADGKATSILADTDELQQELADGGRTDLLIDAIKAKTDNLPASPAAVGSAMTLTSGERDAVAAALLDLSNGVETGETVRQCVRLMRAALLGKSDGFPPGPVHFRDRGDSRNRITATVDADGNRTAVSTDAT
ncbi:MAG: hypothetical protein ACT4QC_17710 [Planctomycetaceae bacterium]